MRESDPMVALAVAMLVAMAEILAVAIVLIL